MSHRANYVCVPPRGFARGFLPVLGLATFLMGWLIVTELQIVNPAFLPGPAATAGAFVEMFRDAPSMVPDKVTGELRDVAGWWDTFKHSSISSGTSASVQRIVMAVFWACVIGLPIGILMGAFGRVEAFFGALLPPLRNAPITAFIPLFLLIYGVEERLKVNFLAFGTMVYIIPVAFDAVRNVRSEYIEKAADLGLSRIEALWYFVLPAALPRLFDGIRICTGIAWTYIVAAEVVNITTGLGAIIESARRMQAQTPRVYAGIMVIMALGVLTDFLFKLAQRHPMLQEEAL